MYYVGVRLTFEVEVWEVMPYGGSATSTSISGSWTDDLDAGSWVGVGDTRFSQDRTRV